MVHPRRLNNACDANRGFVWKRWLPVGLVAMALAFAFSALAEQRFPPPDFESGYTLPGTPTPAPRAWFWQYIDTAVLLAALGLAAWLVFRRRSRRGLLALSLFSLVYFGFYREGCICPIGTPQNVALALFQPGYTLPVTAAVFFFAPLLASLFFGRAFCAAVCPQGALQDLVLVKPVRVPAWLEQGLGVLPYLFLGAGVLFAATGTGFVICRYDPFVPLFRMTGSFFILSLAAGFVVASMFVGRPYCRFLCPYGALLRLGSLVSRWRVRITPDFCTQCQLCEHSCPFGAIRKPTAPPANPAVLAPDRRRLGGLLLALPVLIAAGGWIGSQLGVPASKLHPAVALAERYADPQRPAPAPGPATPDSLALGRAELQTRELLTTAAKVRRQFKLGGWLFGGWVGLVIGVRLISLSLRPSRADFEPDRGACLACGRCYLSCPNERVRVGLISPAEAAALDAVRNAPRRLPTARS